MVDAQLVIDEARPLLKEFLRDIGILRAGAPLDLRHLLEPLSRWVDAQEVTGDGRFYLASRLGAFICKYLIEMCSGQRVVVEGRIIMRVPIKKGIWREFDPYTAAIELATKRNNLKGFLDVDRL